MFYISYLSFVMHENCEFCLVTNQLMYLGHILLYNSISLLIAELDTDHVIRNEISTQSLR